MPPKAKFTREEILSAALGIVRREGADALTARALGSELKSSARPLFTAFDNMEQIRDGVLKLAEGIYAKYVEEGLSQPIAFKGVGTSYIRFAIAEPQFFRLLFMREREAVPDAARVLGVIEENYERILQSVQSAYGFDRERAERVYRHMWIYTHGIAVLIVTRVCAFSAEEISVMLTEVCKGVIAEVKND